MNLDDFIWRHRNTNKSVNELAKQAHCDPNDYLARYMELYSERNPEQNHAVGKHRFFTPAEKAQMFGLYLEGESYAEIARRFDCHITSVRYIIRYFYDNGGTA